MRHAPPAVVLVSAAMLEGCSEGVLNPRGPIASAERLLLINSTAIMLVVVVPVILAIFAFAWWYRASNLRASRLPAENYEGRLGSSSSRVGCLICGANG
jgi:cytochrome o ubiquinol oxidase subunit II